MKNVKGSFFLLIAAFIWGTAFVAQTSAADNIEPFTFNTARSFVGAAFLLVLIAARGLLRKNRQQAPAAESYEEKRRRQKRVLMGGVFCGVILFFAMNFQQIGISIYPQEAAASGRAGFLTATYVVMVALCARFTGKKLHPMVAVATLVCVGGMYLLCMGGGWSGIYMGDVMELICAVCFTAHILVIDHFSDVESMKLCCGQFLVAGILSAAAMLLTESPDMGQLLGAWFPIFYVGVMSSGIAYTLQMVGQKYAPPTVACIVMSLESVFAALAGWIILTERLSGRELLGCVLVFGAVILAQVPQFWHRMPSGVSNADQGDRIRKDISIHK